MNMSKYTEDEMEALVNFYLDEASEEENKMTVIDKVLEQIKKDVGMGDMTAIEELLSEVS